MAFRNKRTGRIISFADLSPADIVRLRSMPDLFEEFDNETPAEEVLPDEEDE